MTDTASMKARLEHRLAELGDRVGEIRAELGHEMEKDLEDQAVDIEDDEVLEGLGNAAKREIALLNAALKRIDDGTYGICQSCGEEISLARLEAVPHAMLCRTCANAASSQGA